MQSNSYKDLVLTNHALKRMRERGITHQKVWETVTYPDSEINLKDNSIEKKKRFEEYEITTIQKISKDHEILIISCWMEPPLPNSRDARQKEWYKKYKRASFFGKIWLEIVRQITR